MAPTMFRQIATILVINISLAGVARSSDGASDLPAKLPNEEFLVGPGVPIAVTVPAPSLPRLRSVLISLRDAGRMAPGLAIEARLTGLNPRSEVDSSLIKSLTCGDPDVLWSIRQARGVPLRITITLPSKTTPLPSPPNRSGSRSGLPSSAKKSSAADAVAFETEPNDKPESANRLTLGQTVYGLADDRPYLPLANRDDRPRAHRRSGLVHVHLRVGRSQARLFRARLRRSRCAARRADLPARERSGSSSTPGASTRRASSASGRRAWGPTSSRPAC